MADGLREKIKDPKCLDSDVICDADRHRAVRSQTMVTLSHQATSSSSQASKSTQKSQPSQPASFSTRLVRASRPLKRGTEPNGDHCPDPSLIPKAIKTFTNDIATSASSSSESTPRESEINSTLNIEDEDDQTLVMNVPFKTSGTSGSSCICCHVNQKLTRISDVGRLDAFTKEQVWIKKGARACKSHFRGEKLKLEAIRIIDIRAKKLDLEAGEFMTFIERLTSNMDSSFFIKFRDIKHLGISDDECKSFTGYNKAIFRDIVTSLKSLRNSDKRTVSQAVVIYLTRLHNGHTLAFLCKMFGPNLEWHDVRNWCNEVEDALMCEVVPKQLGPSSLARKILIEEHTSPVAKALLETGDSKLILVFDSTYIYHQKSGINTFQRQSYSLQKGRPLEKPFICCTTSGHIIQVWDAFSANTSDGVILTSLLNSDSELRNLVQSGDYFILDRGFKNSVAELEAKGIKILMPTCKRGKLTASEANETRFCTKLRWVIESVNGVLKSNFKLLKRVTPNQSLCKLNAEYKIAAALHNMFGTKLSSDHSDFQLVVQEMKRKKNTPNTLEDYVNYKGLNRHKGRTFQMIDQETISNFPQLSENQLKMLTLGSYQLKQASGYLVEHFCSATSRYFECAKEKMGNKFLIRVKIRSRHSGAVKYFIYVSFTPDKVEEWYCTCNTGSRTVGMCSHCAAIVVYFATGMQIPKGVEKAEYYLSMFKKCPLTLVSNEDSDNEEVATTFTASNFSS